MRRPALYAAILLLSGAGAGAVRAAVDYGTRCVLQAERDYEACRRQRNYWLTRLCDTAYDAAIQRCREEVKG
jgi:hypothetical protein